MDSAPQKLTWLISKEKQQNMDQAMWKLTGEEKSSPTTHQADACSCKLTGEKIHVEYVALSTAMRQLIVVQ